MKSTVDIEKLSDESLVQEIKVNRNSELFAILYDRYAHQVYNKCLSFSKSKVEAEDLTHDIFIKLFLKLNTFSGKSKFSTWLYSFTYNYCVNYVQRDAYKNKEVVSEREVESNEEPEVTDAELFQIKTENLQKAMDQIDPKHKMILLLKYQDDCSIKEIQALLDLNESAVKMRLKRAKEKVMEVYKMVIMDNPFKQILNQEELPNKLKGKIMKDISFIKMAIDMAELLAVNYPESLGDLLKSSNNIKDNN